jgi:hypothetical protein
VTRDEAEEFAAGWAEAWNARDLEGVLVHFHDEVVFSSPTALAVVGASSVRGKPALRAYWQAALARIRSLRFSVDRVVWDPARRELAIVYEAEIDGNVRRVSENLLLDTNGVVEAAEVFHGVTRPA